MYETFLVLKFKAEPKYVVNTEKEVLSIKQRNND